MKKISVGIGLALTGILLLSAVPVVAHAQARSAQGSVSGFIGAVNSIGTQLAALNALNGLSAREIQLVDAATILDKGNETVLNNLLAKKAGDISRLQTALGTNAVVVQSLAGSNVAINRVVAIDVKPGGNVVVYYR
ncbi:MAG TPA: hypothetical protein VIF83_06785 [Gemmatimonadaceae bacterium]|jgi:hypothetical protein